MDYRISYIILEWCFSASLAWWIGCWLFKDCRLVFTWNETAAKNIEDNRLMRRYHKFPILPLPWVMFLQLNWYVSKNLFELWFVAIQDCIRSYHLASRFFNLWWTDSSWMAWCVRHDICDFQADTLKIVSFLTLFHIPITSNIFLHRLVLREIRLRPSLDHSSSSGNACVPNHGNVGDF